MTRLGMMISSSELKPIVFYDIPCTTPGRPWSPNTMKTRYCLGYKRLPFTTVWVELPDIAGVLQSKGIAHQPYTLPAIEDPNTGAVIIDSLAIATYLDETYPETPKVMSPAARELLEHAWDVLSFSFGSQAGRRALSSTTGTNADGGALGTKTVSANELTPRLVFLVLAGQRLNPVSKAYYYETSTTWLGEVWTTLISACSENTEGRAECVKKGIEAIRGVILKATALYQPGPTRNDLDVPLSERPSTFLLGEPCFLDFVVAGRIRFLLDGLTPSEVEDLRFRTGEGWLSWWRV